MQHVSPQQQVWKYLRTDDQRATLAENFRHLKHRTQEDLCYGIIAWLRWGIIRPYTDAWVNRTFQAIILYLRNEREIGNI